MTATKSYPDSSREFNAKELIDSLDPDVIELANKFIDETFESELPVECIGSPAATVLLIKYLRLTFAAGFKSGGVA